MRRVLFAFSVVALASVATGCPAVRSTVNASPDLRWWLFSNFGASKICPEMLKRGVPLKLPQLGNASVGRFFPGQCVVQVDDARKAIVMTASGTGYATLPVARRVGFSVAMTVEYLPDFRLESDSTYVWGKFSRFVSPPDMRILGVENPVVSLATRTPAGDVATVIGNGIVASEIGRGFTVVRQEDGDDFTLGHLEPPEKPKRQFTSGKGSVVLGSDRTEVHGQSRDFLGPFEVASTNAALTFHARVEGTPLVYTVVDRSVGEAWRRSYEQVQPNAAAPGTTISQGTLALGEANLKFPVQPGAYYVVVDNQTAAPFAPLGVPLPTPEQVGYVSYSVEVSDR
ncbi:MAG TPA: hypothetical protein VLT33_22310 [Labilithrix sp.]|nr:hypothetical protein [Labilithrix sp.]